MHGQGGPSQSNAVPSHLQVRLMYMLAEHEGVARILGDFEVRREPVVLR